MRVYGFDPAQNGFSNIPFPNLAVSYSSSLDLARHLVPVILLGLDWVLMMILLDKRYLRKFVSHLDECYVLCIDLCFT